MDEQLKVGDVVRIDEERRKIGFFGAPIETEYLVSEINDTKQPFRMEYVLMRLDTGAIFRFVPLQGNPFTITRRFEQCEKLSSVENKGENDDGIR